MPSARTSSNRPGTSTSSRARSVRIRACWCAGASWRPNRTGARPDAPPALARGSRSAGRLRRRSRSARPLLPDRDGRAGAARKACFPGHGRGGPLPVRRAHRQHPDRAAQIRDCQRARALRLPPVGRPADHPVADAAGLLPARGAGGAAGGDARAARALGFRRARPDRAARAPDRRGRAARGGRARAGGLARERPLAAAPEGLPRRAACRGRERGPGGRRRQRRGERDLRPLPGGRAGAGAAVILLVRHGETASNAARVVQTPETPLSPRGLQQADRIAARLKSVGVSRILSSDLARALETARRVQAACGAPLVLEPLLEERNFGDIRGTPYAKLGFDLFGPDYAPPGGESWEAFHQRVDRAWARVRAEAAATPGNL